MPKFHRRYRRIYFKASNLVYWTSILLFRMNTRTIYLLSTWWFINNKMNWMLFGSWYIEREHYEKFPFSATLLRMTAELSAKHFSQISSVRFGLPPTQSKRDNVTACTYFEQWNHPLNGSTWDRGIKITAEYKNWSASWLTWLAKMK